MSAQHPTKSEIEYYATLDSVRVEGFDLTGPALARMLLAEQTRAEKAEKERDEAQKIAAGLAEVFNDLADLADDLADLADILDLPTGAVGEDVLDAVRKLVGERQMKRDLESRERWLRARTKARIQNMCAGSGSIPAPRPGGSKGAAGEA